MNIKIPKVPTLAEMILDALTINRMVRAFSLVREPKAERPPALCIVMMGKPAIRQFGPLIEAHARLLRQPKAGNVAWLDFKCTIADAFEEMERLGWDFGYIQGEIGERQTLVALIVGNSITNQFCAQLTARGCITKLK